MSSICSNDAPTAPFTPHKPITYNLPHPGAINAKYLQIAANATLTPEEHRAQYKAKHPDMAPPPEFAGPKIVYAKVGRKQSKVKKIVKKLGCGLLG